MAFQIDGDQKELINLGSEKQLKIQRIQWFVDLVKKRVGLFLKATKIKFRFKNWRQKGS